MKTLFIAGNAHSGTTILEQLIAKEFSVLALGEVYYAFQAFQKKEIQRYQCSCKHSTNCVWSKIIIQWNKQNPSEYFDAYQILLDVIKVEFPDIKVISDSSKYPTALNKISSLKPDTILISKHPKAWITSALRRRINKKGPDLNWFNKFKIRYRFMRSWSRLNSFFLNKTDIHVLTYENLVFHPQKTLEVLHSKLEFLEKNKKDEPNILIHQLIGNVIRHDEFNLKYDSRWIWKRDLNTEILMLMPIVQKTILKINNQTIHPDERK